MEVNLELDNSDELEPVLELIPNEIMDLAIPFENQLVAREDEQQFDIRLPASHSYMGSDLVAVSGRSVLEAGWEGRVPALMHHGCVFPGETVPMLINEVHDRNCIVNAIRTDKLFGLLFPNESGQVASGYGVICEIFEAALAPASVTFKARAVHRLRLVDDPDAFNYTVSRMQPVRVRVLPEVRAAAPLRHARPASLDALRSPHHRQDKLIKTLDAAVTPWPMFVYEIFDYERMRDNIREYFSELGLDTLLPEEPVSLSFWVASNLTLSGRDRLALFLVDDALQRLHMECSFIERKSVLCCSTCMTEIARRDHVFAMSSEGVHSNYTNLVGYVHDVVTVSRVRNTLLSGTAVREYSWFPGYAWRVALCASCSSHVGWRYTALHRGLRPSMFYGLCRNYVQPRNASPPP